VAESMLVRGIGEEVNAREKGNLDEQKTTWFQNHGAVPQRIRPDDRHVRGHEGKLSNQKHIIKGIRSSNVQVVPKRLAYLPE
jgi:hypothetical protein